MEKSLSLYIIIKKIIKYLSMPLSVSNQVKLKKIWRQRIPKAFGFAKD